MTGWRAAVVWLVAASGILAIALGQVLNPADWIIVLIIGEVVMSFGLVGAVVVTRLPGNQVGWLLWGSGAALGWSTVGIAYATQSFVACGGCQPATAPIAVVANTAFAPIVGVVGIFVPLLFPDGRLPSARWRPVGWFAVIATALFTAAIAFAPGPISGGVDNPIGIAAFGGEGNPGGIVVLGSLLVAMVLALASVVWRFRHAGVVQRQQLRWFGYAALLMLAVAGSTLVAFALFQPLRRRVQRAVDHRFDRARYDGQRTADAFAEHLRSDVDLAWLRASLATTAADAVRPTSSSLWLSTRGVR